MATAVTLEDYHKFIAGRGWIELANWTVLRMGGPDRVRFLHGLCTNDIRRLQPGQGCEAFITSAQGKILGHVIVLADEHSLWLVGTPGQARQLLEHFTKYQIREELEFEDRSGSWALVLVGGAAADGPLLPGGWALPPAEAYSHCREPRLENAARWIRWVPCRWLALLMVPRASHDQWSAIAEKEGIQALSSALWEPLRIELGWPVYGHDIRAENFPQEIGRDQLAISFTKGCYLGQETVARIDALGHVNRMLRGLAWPDGVECRPDSVYHYQGKIAAYVTSAAYSPHLQGWAVMGFVRRGFEKPGSTVPLDGGASAVVRQFPLGYLWQDQTDGSA
ncbi:MAG: glycine cleavage system protein T [Pirellulaceae bacterium]|nr:MAG: glycine cleavage system protein T [Pirellulaceae bacterium]